MWQHCCSFHPRHHQVITYVVAGLWCECTFASDAGSGRNVLRIRILRHCLTFMVNNYFPFVKQNANALCLVICPSTKLTSLPSGFQWLEAKYVPKIWRAKWAAVIGLNGRGMRSAPNGPYWVARSWREKWSIRGKLSSNSSYRMRRSLGKHVHQADTSGMGKKVQMPESVSSLVINLTSIGYFVPSIRGDFGGGARQGVLDGW